MSGVSVGDVFEDTPWLARRRPPRTLHVRELLWSFPRGPYVSVEVARVSNVETGRTSTIRVDRLLSSRYRRVERNET